MKSKTSVYVFIVLAAAYIGLVLFMPVDTVTAAKYHLAPMSLRLLGLTVAIPLVCIWSMALFGYLRLRGYARMVKGTREGPALNKIALGLMVMTFGLPFESVLTSLFKLLTNSHPHFAPTAAIVGNYIGLLISLLSFYLIAEGVCRLVETLKTRAKRAYKMSEYGAVGVIVFSSIFTWLILTRPVPAGAIDSSYYLPNWLIIVTLAIPYILAWRKGLQAAYYLYLYYQHLKGRIYRSAFRDLAHGIGIVVLVSVLIQVILASSERVNRLHLTPLLAIVYVLLILYAVGFGLMARGAKQLKKIEEV